MSVCITAFRRQSKKMCAPFRFAVGCAIVPLLAAEVMLEALGETADLLSIANRVGTVCRPLCLGSDLVLSTSFRGT
jgi:hypothetical protein